MNDHVSYVCMNRWLARGQFGKTGLVPKNYVQVISDNDNSNGNPNNGGVESAASSVIQKEMSKLLMNGSPAVSSKSSSKSHSNNHSNPERDPVRDEIWYFGLIPRNQCDSLLNEFAEDGDFLVRESETSVSRPTS